VFSGLKRLDQLGSAMKKAADDWARAMEPTSELLRQAAEGYRQSLDQLREAFRPFVEHAAKLETVAAAGWLPHQTMPFSAIHSGDAPEAVGILIEEHYRTQWAEAELDLSAQVAALRIDDEAKATFEEALTAHKHGLFRVAPRLLFPELERVSRKELKIPPNEPNVSQRLLRESGWHLPAGLVAPVGFDALRFMEALSEGLYATVQSEDEIQAAKLSPVPNRHAAIHGRVSYATSQTSLNMIFMAAFMFELITVLARAMADEEDGQQG
jgi:hypothetical protein